METNTPRPTASRRTIPTAISSASSATQGSQDAAASTTAFRAALVRVPDAEPEAIPARSIQSQPGPAYDAFPRQVILPDRFRKLGRRTTHDLPTEFPKLLSKWRPEQR